MIENNIFLIDCSDSEEKNKELEVNKNNLLIQLEETKGKYYSVQEQNKEYEHEIQDLTNQISFNLERKERELNLKNRKKYSKNNNLKLSSQRKGRENERNNNEDNDYKNNNDDDIDDDDSVDEYEINNIMKDINDD